MAFHTITSREFNQDVGAAKKAAAEGPVFITDRGKLAHVLLTIDQYQALIGSSSQSIVELLAQPDAADIEFEPAKADFRIHPADLD